MFLHQYEHPSYTFLLIEENKNFFYMCLFFVYLSIIIVISSYLELLYLALGWASKLMENYLNYWF